MILSTLSLHSFSKADPDHLIKAREAVSEFSRPGVSRKPKTCFAFVNQILAKTLSKPALTELNELHQKVQATLPSTHLFPEIIPYHYSLIADHLKHKENRSVFWGTRQNFFEAKVGDIFIYMDPTYNPDASQRKPNEPAGTHVGFIDELFTDQNNDRLSMRIIDYSLRKKGRGFSPDFYKTTDNPSLNEDGVAYSILSLKAFAVQKRGDKAVWECRFMGQRTKSKFVSLIYPIYQGN